jgi:flavin-dependent dehydrogenase
VALISRDSHDRLEHALPKFPEIAGRLKCAGVATDERGGVTLTRRFRAVHRGCVALIGDASGSVDAITGEGLCLAFQQARALADAIEHRDLSRYGAAHAHILKKPGLMAGLMLSFDGHPRWRDRVFRTLTAKPRVFADMLALHVGELKPGVLFSSGFSIARHMVTGGGL